MTDHPTGDRARTLRAAFDASFAAAPSPDRDEVPLLEVQVGDVVIAIALDELALVVASSTVSPLPGAAPGVLGLAAVRGDLLSVHSLAALLGRDDPAGGARPLLVLARPARPALAVDVVRGLVRVPRAALARHGARPAIVHAVVTDAATWAVLDVAAVVLELERRARRGAGAERDAT